MTCRYFPALFVLTLLMACSDVQNVDSSDWKRYEWMKEILGEQIVAEGGTHNIDTGEYKFAFTTPLPPDSAIAEFDKRAVQSGWLVRDRDGHSRIYTRREAASGQREGRGCISIQPRQESSGFEFQYRATFDCRSLQ